MEESCGTKEFKGCAVEDRREAKSIAKMADRLWSDPELSFSSAVGSALRQAAWRIFSKKEVDISCGHYPLAGASVSLVPSFQPYKEKASLELIRRGFLFGFR